MSIPEQNVTNDVLQALVSAGVVDTFQRLALEQQENFMEWITGAPDEAAYWRRIEILVMGMCLAPPITTPRDPSHLPGFWTNPIGRA